ncbi:REP-associated tyrosine transposase [Pseudomonas capsici]|uniref:REP-associated tyrosine transposase n=1 Tax=Pseudomonas capsici TaxID=2810614 RepID=UPI0021F2441E|nr:transposase [Pseudomonas capsici]MCV4340119.1 transposase [Pseudomonas capsici]
MSISSRGADLRKGRYSETGRIYLLTSVVHERRPRSLAWVVMPDHFHWLVELQSGSLGLLMRRVKSGSSRAVIVAGSVQSRVWQKGYHDRTVRREEDLRSIARYIVANPLRAGLVQKVGDYPLWDAIWL